MPSNRRPRVAEPALLALLLAACAAWLNSLGGSFQFDDYQVIVDNPAVHSLSAWWASMPGIRPLLKFSYTLNWSLDPAPFGFHLFNLAVHLANTAMVFLLCRRLLTTVEAGGGIALVAALVFALHPAQTEAVTYISGRSVSLMAFFYLAALLAYEEGRARDDRRLMQLVSPALFAAAVLVKETAVTLPLALLLWERLRDAGPWRDSLRRLSVHAVVLALLTAGMFLSEGYRALLAVSTATRGAGENLLVQVHGVFYLVSRPLLGLAVNADPVIVVGDATGTLLKGGLLAALLAAGFLQLRRRPAVGFALLWFFLHLLPTNSVVARLDIANDRQLYLALIGPALLLAMGAARLWTGRLLLPLGLVLGVTLGAATAWRNLDYRNEVTFWEAAARESPEKARVWNNLGYAYQSAGRRSEALKAYGQALRLDPGYVQAAVNQRLLRETME